ncbi:MAG: hypothetical protein PHP45_03155 [Elusimicrobiales bacterium]|nr:hypothetical protein [Elusimicrobiales bacterium]
MTNIIENAIAKFHSSYGIYVDLQEVYICRVISEFRGVRVDKAYSGSLAEKPLGKHLQDIFPNAIPVEDAEILASLEKSRNIFSRLWKKVKNLPELMSVGIKDTSVFYYAFALPFKPQGHLDIDAVISENPRAEFLQSTNLTNAWTSLQLGEQNHVLMCVAKRATVDDVWNEFDKLGLRPVRVEAGTIAALRAAWHYSPPPPVKLPEIRVLIGPTMTLAALSLGSMPLSWQLVHVEKERLTESMFPVIQSFLIYTQKQLNLASVCQVVLQGDWVTEADAARLAEMLGTTPCKAVQSKPYDGHLTAFGLALGALDMDRKIMNFTREVQKPISTVIIFPFLETIITTAIVMTCLLFMLSQTARLQNSVRMQRSLNEQNAWAAKLSSDDISASNEDIKRQINPLHDLFTNKVPWCELLETLSKLLSPNVRLVSLTAQEPVWSGGRTAPAMSLVLVARSGEKTKPEDEIEELLATLRETPEIRRYFPRATINSVSMIQSTGEMQASISLGK